MLNNAYHLNFLWYCNQPCKVCWQLQSSFLRGCSSPDSPGHSHDLVEDLTDTKLDAPSQVVHLRFLQGNHLFNSLTLKQNQVNLSPYGQALQREEDSQVGM